MTGMLFEYFNLMEIEKPTVVEVVGDAAMPTATSQTSGSFSGKNRCDAATEAWPTPASSLFCLLTLRIFQLLTWISAGAVVSGRKFAQVEPETVVVCGPARRPWSTRW